MHNKLHQNNYPRFLPKTIMLRYLVTFKGKVHEIWAENRKMFNLLIDEILEEDSVSYDVNVCATYPPLKDKVREKIIDKRDFYYTEEGDLIRVKETIYAS